MLYRKPWLWMALPLFAFAILLYGCSGLQKSQVEAARNFALATRGISRVPSDIYLRIYQLKSEAQTLQLSAVLATNDQGQESIDLLKQDYAQRLNFIHIAEEYSASYRIVEQYADLVLCLLDNNHLKQFYQSKDAWEVSFNRLVNRYNSVALHGIPPAVTGLTASIVQQMGRLKLAQLQKKYLKQALHTAREPFENICADYLMLDSLKIQSEIANLTPYLDHNYANFLENIRAYQQQGNNPYEYYHAYAPIYSNWLNQVAEIASLSAKTMEAFRQLKKAFGRMEDYVNANNPGPMPVEIKELMIQYGTLADAYKEFETHRQKLNAASFIN